MDARKTLFNPAARQSLLARLRALDPATPPRWGRMSAPQMVAHLTDQMHHALEESPVAGRPGPLRWAWVRWASIYLLPWPKGRIKGPPEAFLTQPVSWPDDVERLAALIERVAARGPADEWPEHALFGPMTGKDWGFFVHKHLDHHLRQFGA